MIERFCHLKDELDRFGITKTREETIDKVIEALPRSDHWQTFVFVLKNDVLFDEITLDTLIEKIESHELELQKQNKMSSSTYQQNVGLYYKGSLPSTNQSPKPGTAFTIEKSKDSKKGSSSSYNPGYHSSSTTSNTEGPEEIHCNISLKLKNSPTLSINAAKQQISFFASILESYESLVAGRIGNPELTKEDYDQIDPEEMELIDIRWCLASDIRRAQCFMEITGRQDHGGLLNTKLGFDKSKVTCFHCKQKGHFKRECVNREVADHSNPFHDDYYKKAIYHKNSEHTSRANLKQITEGSSKDKTQALVTVNDDKPKTFHDDEGFNWRNT
ncbi:putative transcription factor interactor and regulator CCHC(Zn) family [Helianthus annuus]|uniref:Transcription factor interactor and regulator CCHC(Zn) family n=1 Tax=Helianthus annuus TaxID=4232 RepID=A0A9K3JTT8_HELAN|nr:putative transcription factor interactor and regulator CCHC(Zn) family [Helianthus annuus]KAJ0610750.1 putative transcription factor interactor and regulator CCHC(Zn) family [Helianthus annuus]KAJ0621539.1 putative transcription factor interactor and regulator CCHC(Zn) family [Helianthus annuus]KAJ0626000.1 putative transcription factor interactor and regulator CCHC(Zn) family [Helianthus annuus]KAJ0782344.1 putative transcription factor interactor and regulator CCHC(Zn) family [Helianthus a